MTRREMAALRRANQRKGWGFSYKDIEEMITKHKNGDAKAKAKVEYQLEDANWHSLNRALQAKKYGTAQKLNDKDFPNVSDREGYSRSVAYRNVGG